VVLISQTLTLGSQDECVKKRGFSN